MSGYRQVQNVSSLVATIESLDGNAAVFPCWQSHLKDVLAVRDSMVYTAIEMSLDNAIRALEAHEVSLNSTNQSDIVAAASAKHFACSNCGKLGHQSSNCQKKNHGKTKAGAPKTVKLGGYNSGSFDDEEEIGVIYE
ncbi:uncharacterized protein PGTG_14423 [Puccinia graminis f. sp. tritici CRL 75-36-700-3]|uniref:CCHC-type domain-containing protein n=1 Tax=Puccinia graminis f. sp. tritici (strain CRL 75-36-700-3 / race SCCL) TaxID=418459 RepID=E3KVJ9_PUCGT|nr:uncharacterized protein PGTG_14423 [Puccinia graminis f. sp. tritici CRL 75-36-700-3]EFP88339.1 hypothetical protein PGTG_14423 [Puccinia graminis f. sp. tritici CRL 75-36-700-3]